MDEGIKREPPCKHCCDRNVGCHGVCKDYIEWAKASKEAKMHERLSRPKVLYSGDFTGTSPKPGVPRFGRRSPRSKKR